MTRLFSNIWYLVGAALFTVVLLLAGMARAQGDPGAGAGPGPAASTVGIEPTQPSILAPCIDMDGPNGPAPCISDPVKHLSPSLDTVAAARKLGWPVALGTALFFVLVILGAKVPYLREGKRALYIAGATAVLAAGVNAGFDNGEWMAMLFAAAGVALKLVQGDRTVAAQAKGVV